MPDSIVHTVDSVSRLNGDTVLLKDSLARVDSIACADSLKSLMSRPAGFEGISHPSFPSVENWVFIAIVFLFLIFVLGVIPSFGKYYQNMKTFFSRKESINLLQTPTTDLAWLQIFTTIFSVGMIALLSYEVLFSGKGRFELKIFAILVGITAVFYMVKHALFDMVGYTFFNGKITKTYKNMYFSLLNALTILLFPVLVLYTFQPSEWQQPLKITTVLLVGGFYIFLIIKLLQIFHTKTLDLFYIFLYLCTLEIIPIFIVFRAYNFIV